MQPWWRTGVRFPAPTLELGLQLWLQGVSDLLYCTLRVPARTPAHNQIKALISTYNQNKTNLLAGEMVRALVAPAQDPGSVLQHLQDGSQPSLAPVPGDPVFSSGFQGHQAHTSAG